MKRREFERLLEEINNGMAPGEAALRYAEMGIKVFPCGINSKQPATRHGFKDATTDPGVIESWWWRGPERWHERNIGMPTSVMHVLDVDRTPDGDGYPSLARLLRAGLIDGWFMRSSTPSGGMHLFFAADGQRSGSLPRRFIDFKADRGYVLLPPSVAMSKVSGEAERYRWEEVRGGRDPLDWDACRDLLQPRARTSTAWTGPSDIGALAAKIRREPEGNRNALLHWAAHRCIDSGTDPMALLGAAEESGLDRTESMATIESAIRQRESS